MHSSDVIITLSLSTNKMWKALALTIWHKFNGIIKFNGLSIIQTKPFPVHYPNKGLLRIPGLLEKSRGYYFILTTHPPREWLKPGAGVSA